MVLTITAEHFELPGYLREETEKAIRSLGGLLNRASSVKLHFKKCARFGFDGIITIQSKHGEFVYHATNERFHALLHALRAHMREALGSAKAKRVQRRKH